MSQWRIALVDETWEDDDDEYITLGSVAGDDCLAPGNTKAGDARWARLFEPV